MGCIGCCNQCCLSESELPEMSISGMTGAGWVQQISDTCCWEQEFTFDTDPIVEFLTVQAGDSSLEQTSVFDIVWYYPGGRINYSLEDPAALFTLPYPDVSGECCFDVFTAGTVTDYAKSRRQQRFEVLIRKAKIILRIQKRIMECRENACRWVVTAIYEYGYATQTDLITYDRRLSTLSEDFACSDKTSSFYDIDTTSGTDTFPTLDPADYPDYPPIGDSDPKLRFIYIKDYETLPSSIVFDNTPSEFDSEESFDCIGDLCNIEEPVHEICLTYSYNITSIGTITTSYSLSSANIIANPTRCTGQTISYGLFSGGVFSGTAFTTLPNVTCTDWTGNNVSVTPSGSNIVRLGNLKNIGFPRLVFSSLGTADCRNEQPQITIAEIVATGVAGWAGTGGDYHGQAGVEDQVSFDSVGVADLTGTAEVCISAPTFTVSITPAAGEGGGA